VKPVAVDELVALPDEQWDQAIEASGRPFRFSHRAAAGRAFEAAYEEYRFEPYRVVYRDGTSLLVPLVRVQRRARGLTMLLGMPLGLEGTPIVTAGDPTAGHADGLFHALGGRGVLALHGGACGSPPGAGSAPFETHILDLRPGFEWLWDNAFSSKNRNSCRKAERAGVEVNLSDDVDAYYDLYAAASRAWGYPEPPYPRALMGALLESGSGELWMGHLDGEPIAGALLLHGSQDTLYWSGAVAAEHRTLAPGNAVIKTAIAAGCDRGTVTFDFGASTGLPGVSAFKESFGAAEVSYRNLELSSRGYRIAERLQRATARVRPGS
jgi:hypothetical protein